ncbi:G-protein coupled receptor [Biomphalaria pfeifferi]|uniref:G-protein coupled receptor n=1 Tax=Biomphalaria pfeifferi TaxID=112525 RepID=A0AAD8FJD3_BIOPF|nr:G-protein coupled receptor [Biomphalaria pfeifferi]
MNSSGTRTATTEAPVTQVTPVNPVVNNEVYYFTVIILYSALTIFSFTGLVTNALNMLVFVSQGLTSDSITVLLFAMSVSDLLSSIFMFPWLVCFFMGRMNVSLVRNNYCYSMSTMSASLYRVIFTRVTCLIQTYISVERVFFVVFPLRVNSVIRTRNTIIVNVGLCIVIFMMFTPYLAHALIEWSHDLMNLTVATLVENSEDKTVIAINSGLIIPNVDIVVNSLATVVIVHRFSVMQKFRENLSSSRYSVQKLKSQGMLSKNVEVSKTVIVITSIYVINLICNQLQTMIFFTYPEVTQEGLNKNLYFVLYISRFVIEALLSTTNMFCYLRMSSKFRQVFKEIFSISKK